MAAGKKSGGPEKPLQEDRILARLVDDSTQITSGLASYTGLLGRSPKEGYWLLYQTLDMSLSVEIREEDIVHSEQLPPDKSPFGSLGGTQVFVKKDAKVTTTRTVSRTHDAGAGRDEFDLDIRLGGGSGPVRAKCDATVSTCLVDCWLVPGGGPKPPVPEPDPERPGTKSCFNTCHTCFVGDCDPATIAQTCKLTCQGQTCLTCNTCYTDCNTCYACPTEGDQRTCDTCNTCYPCGTKVNTCYCGNY